jgi:hypothetical protein
LSRAHGRQHTPRTAELTPQQVREFGVDEREIPGGQNHLANRETRAQKVPYPDDLGDFRGMMAHGVPPEEYGLNDRDHPGRPYKPEYAKLPEPVCPVPVYIVESGAGARGLKHTAMKHFQAPAIGNEPVTIVGQDVNRSIVRVLNSDSTHSAWIGQLNDLVFDSANTKIVGGAILPKGMTSYLPIETQGPLYVVSDDSGTPLISVIIETQVAGAG